MARTFHHGDRGKAAKAKKLGVPEHWLYNEPKWWTTTFKHRPRRRELARAINRFLNGYEVVWPLDRKPREYYW